MSARHIPAFWGVEADTAHLFAAARRAGRFIYMDHCYFGPRRGHVRITWDRIQHPGIGDGDPDRFTALGLPVAPWRKTGEHVLVTPPGDRYLSAIGAGFTAEDWGHRVKAQIWDQTDRPIRWRIKPNPNQTVRPLAEDLVGAWCLITHLSATAIEAALLGIPVFLTSPDAAARPIAADLWSSDLEVPRLDGDRESWAATLANNQWTLDEIKSGRAWSDLRARDGHR